MEEAAVEGTSILWAIIVWIIVGLLGGSLAGLLITWEREGFGLLRDLGLGLAGAIVGGLLFRLFGLFPILDNSRSRSATSSRHSLDRLSSSSRFGSGNALPVS